MLLPRCAEAIVAVLAVIKTRAAYVPMDPAHPDARLGMVLGDAAPIAVITTADLRLRVDTSDVPVIDINDPAIDAGVAAALPAPPPTTSPTSSTPRAPPACPRAWPSRTAM